MSMVKNFMPISRFESLLRLLDDLYENHERYFSRYKLMNKIFKLPKYPQTLTPKKSYDFELHYKDLRIVEVSELGEPSAYSETLSKDLEKLVKLDVLKKTIVKEQWGKEKTLMKLDGYEITKDGNKKGYDILSELRKENLSF